MSTVKEEVKSIFSVGEKNLKLFTKSIKA